jgi:hypothetical protein
VTPFANRRSVANLASWVTGTEGSNPSLSAKSKDFLVSLCYLAGTRQQRSRSNIDQNFARTGALLSCCWRFQPRHFI